MADGIIINPFMDVFFANVVVTFPIGTTRLTATCGTEVLTATDLSTGSYTFPVPFAGEWVITGTNGESTSTTTVSVTSYGQTVSPVISYRLYLFKEGQGIIDNSLAYIAAPSDMAYVRFTQNSISLGASINTEGYGGVGAAIVGSDKAIDISKYKKLYVECDHRRANEYGGYQAIGISTYRLNAYDFGGVKETRFSKGFARSVQTVDISSYTGSYYIFATMYPHYMTIYNMYLE